MRKLKEKIIFYLVKSIIRKSNKEKKWKIGKWIQYSGPFFDEKEYINVIKTLLKGWFILGEQGRKFELTFSRLLWKKDGILTNSGSSANLLMVSMLKSKRTFDLAEGSKFITPVVCFPTTINPLIQNGFKPVFVDVELPNLNLNLDHVEDLLKKDKNKEIKGIIFAHVLGNPPDMDRLMSLVEKYDLIFLEDCCDGLGSKWEGKPLGSFGVLSTCSFFPAHHMTMGEGGFVGCNDANHKVVLNSLRDWGRACVCNVYKPGNVTEGTACKDRFNNWFESAPDVVYDHRYVFDEIGYNLKPTELQASLGLTQIEKLPEMEAKRKHNFNRLYEIFSKYEKYFYLPKKLDKADPCWFGFLVTLKENTPFSRTELVEFLEQCNIQTRSYFTGNALFHPAYKDLAKEYKDPYNDFPIATKSTKDTFFLGVYPGIDDEQLDYIGAILDYYLCEYES